MDAWSRERQYKSCVLQRATITDAREVEEEKKDEVFLRP